MTAAQAVIDAYFLVPFAWGRADCVAMAATCLRALGHPDPLAKVLRYRSETGAKRALLRLGHRSLEEALDALGLERIAPAATLPGDIVQMPGEGAFPALGVVIDHDRVLAFAVMNGVAQGIWGELRAATSAWRSI